MAAGPVMSNDEAPTTQHVFSGSSDGGTRAQSPDPKTKGRPGGTRAPFLGQVPVVANYCRAVPSVMAAMGAAGS
jgi:hypothetical protein